MPETTNSHTVEVHVKSLITAEEVAFPAEWTSTLQWVWDEAYLKLEEKHRDGDTFRCQGGTDLMPFLGLTLAQAQEQHLCEGRHFEIRGPSGGARVARVTRPIAV